MSASSSFLITDLLSHGMSKQILINDWAKTYFILPY